MNMDGSTFMVGIGVVPAVDIKQALSLFDQYLQTQQMHVLELRKCEQYRPEDLVEPMQDNCEIKEVAEQALETGKIFYVCGISSEALDCMEKAVWVMSFKARILKSSPLAMDDSEYTATEAATFASSEKDAHSQLLHQLQNAKLELVENYQNFPFDSTECAANIRHRDDILRLVEEVRFTGKFRFGIFRAPEQKDV